MYHQSDDSCSTVTVKIEKEIAIKMENIDSKNFLNDSTEKQRGEMLQKTVEDHTNAIKIEIIEHDYVTGWNIPLSDIKTEECVKLDKGIKTELIDLYRLEGRSSRSDNLFTDDTKVTKKMDVYSQNVDIKDDIVDSDSNIPLSDVISQEKDEFSESETRFIMPEPSELNRNAVRQSENSNIGEGGTIEIPVKSHVCRECDRAFSKKSHLDEHIIVFHLKLKKFVCGECDGAFSKKVNLIRHLSSVHRKLKKFLCAECERPFSEQGHLKSHMDSVHKKLKKYACGECERAFSRRGQLKIHLDDVHRKLKRFVCSKCDSGFKRQGDLNMHLDAVHRKLKTFICSECDRAFSKQWNLKVHLNSVHNT